MIRYAARLIRKLREYCVYIRADEAGQIVGGAIQRENLPESRT
jgi:hypothetical protein